MRVEIVAYVVKVIEEVLSASVGPDDVDRTPLGRDGLDLESLSLLELTVHVERHYDVRFGEDELDALGGMTVGGLVDLIEAKVGAAAGGKR